MFGLSFEDESRFHKNVAYGMIYTAIPQFLTLYYLIDAPWGKHTPKVGEQWYLGPFVNARWSWFAFESQNLMWSMACFVQKDRTIFTSVNLVLLTMFVVHYINRAIFHPLRMSPESKPMPLAVVFAAFVFCNFNGYLQAQHFCQFRRYGIENFLETHFIVGVTMYIFGFSVNLHSDGILRNLRMPGESGYQIPRGGLFDLVSGAHYLGEIVEWTGYAIASNSLPGYAFAIYTASNLIPRAVSHHRWYQEHFKDYPMERQAVIPFLW